MSVGSNGMRQHAVIEVVVGFIVLAALCVIVGIAIGGRFQRGDDGYLLHAAFDHIDGLSVGSDVRLAGVTIGHVTSTSVDPKSFDARVAFTVQRGVALPKDSAAIITSDSLLGGKYIALSPGGERDNLSPGGVILQTQGSISLEQLLSKFIFSVTNTLTEARKVAGGKRGSAS